MDFRFLFEEAIHAAQQFSGDIWTDYNAHDPGVTLLEYLCYAITDLGYRTNFPIEDLLYAKVPSGMEQKDNALHPAEEILPTAPLTINDYRKLIIDAEDRVNNVWVMPMGQTIYQGLYEIKLQLSAVDENDPHHYQLIDRVRNCLMETRNLGEDIARISVLQHRNFALQGQIVLRADALAESVMARILQELDHYLIPRIIYANWEQLREQSYTSEQIYNGPLLKHGFLTDEALKDLPSVVYVSEIKDLILAIDGVRSVTKLGALIDGVTVPTDEIEIPENTYLVLDKRMVEGKLLRPLELVRNGSPVPVNYRQVYQIFQRLQARKARQYQHQYKDKKTPLPTSEKRLSDIAAYYSFQRFLPVVYGIGPYGLPRDVGRRRRAQANQLKGYLSIAELFLASYLEQLTHLRSFFSIEEIDQKTPSYFHQFPFDIPDVETIIKKSRGSNQAQDIEAELLQLVRAQDESSDRRNRFLDHLMARFGERIDADVFDRLAILHNWSPAHKGQQLLQAKARVLRHIVPLTQRRACGYNYLKPSWGLRGEKANISGFKDRLSHYLNFPRIGNLSLGTVPAFSNYRWQKSTDDQGSEAGIKISMRQLLAYGQEESSYHIYPGEDGQYELHFHAGRHEEPQLVGTAPTAEACTRLRHDLMRYLKLLECKSLGLFVVEHILLRPQRQLGRKMEIKIKEDGLDFHFESIHYQSPERVAQSSNIFLITATKPGNIELVELELDGKPHVVIVIKEDEYPILISHQPIPGRSADIKIDALLLLLNKKKQQGSASIDKWISYETEPDYGQKAGSIFFSHRLSIVVPKWPKTFQSNSFRALFQNQIRENLPAHLSAQIHWLGVSDMQAFENLYRRWLEARQLEDDLLQIDQYARDLVYFLADEKTRADLDGIEEEKRKNLAIDQALFDRLKYSYLLHGNEMQVIEGIGPKISHLLRLNGIEDWQDLARTPADDLRRILLRNGLRLLQNKVDSWIEQAELAHTGKWDELISYQRELHVAPKGKRTSPVKLFSYIKARFHIELPS